LPIADLGELRTLKIGNRQLAIDNDLLGLTRELLVAKLREY